MLLLTGCKPGEDKAIQLAKNEMSASMKDPDSAKFRYMRFIKENEKNDGSISGTVCGQVNGKNGFGAYAGFTPFIVKLTMKEKDFSKVLIIQLTVSTTFLSQSQKTRRTI
jgi:hypothetical protein